MNGKTLISAAVPAYNAEATLVRALKSVPAQIQPPNEIIVVDDVSSDDTARLMKSYADHGDSLREHRGAAGARNSGIGGGQRHHKAV